MNKEEVHHHLQCITCFSASPPPVHHQLQCINCLSASPPAMHHNLQCITTYNASQSALHHQLQCIGCSQKHLFQKILRAIPPRTPLGHFSQVPWGPNFVQNGDPILSEMGTFASTNGAPKKWFMEHLSKRANFFEIQRRKITGKHLHRAWLHLVYGCTG